MHIAIQTAVVTIISYNPLSGLNFARCTGQYGSYMPSSPLGSISPFMNLDVPPVKNFLSSLFSRFRIIC